MLVVDDEPQIRRLLRRYLEVDGFDVDEAGTGQQALRLAHPPPAAVLLDIGLPDIDGLEVLRLLRERGDVPVLLVTARAEEVDTLVGLSVGADDYITKPFSPREVVARVKTVLRRAGPGPTGPPGALVFEEMTIDPQRRELTRFGAPVALSALEFDLLAALAASPGRVFSRSQLLQQVWGHDFYGDERVVDVHIRSIRRALGDDAADPRVVATVRGVGYKFVATPRDGR